MCVFESKLTVVVTVLTKMNHEFVHASLKIQLDANLLPIFYAIMLIITFKNN